MRNRILAVEDDKAILELLQMNLTVAGYNVVCIPDGLEAANLVHADQNFDLALLDIMLPGMDGFSLFDHIQPYGIPVIYLTAKNDTASKITGLRGKAEDYIVKPFDILELLVRIEKVLERSGRASTAISIGNIDIDLQSRIVKKSGEVIPLKPLEFEVLVLLAKNKNIAVTREKLLSEVWGVDFAGETRTVDVHIGQLRRKLGVSVISIPKIGYRLED